MRDKTILEVSRVIATGEPGRFGAEVDEEWTIGGKPNGGYLLAMMSTGSGVRGCPSPCHRGQCPLCAARRSRARSSCSRPSSSGPVAPASQARVRMSQEDQDCVEALVTTSQLVEATAPYWEARGCRPPSRVPYDGCVPLVPVTPGGIEVAILEQIEVRLEPESRGFTTGSPERERGAPGLAGTVRGRALRSGVAAVRRRRLPPGDLRDRILGLGTHVGADRLRPRPARARVRCRILQRAQLIEAQRVDETCFVWDGSGAWWPTAPSWPASGSADRRRCPLSFERPRFWAWLGERGLSRQWRLRWR